MKKSDELKEFESASGEIPAAVQDGLLKTEKVIATELNRSYKRFFGSFLVFSVLGYFFSLAVCSQNSIALTHLSVSVASALHQLPDPWCPIVCGTVFSSVPLVCLFVFLDRFQRRRLMTRFWWLPVLTTLGTCLLMSVLPTSLQHEGMHMTHTGHPGLRATQGDVHWLIWWTLAAVSMPLLVAWLARIRTTSSTESRAR